MHNIDHHVPIKLTASSKLCELNSEHDRAPYVFTTELESKIGYWNSLLINSQRNVNSSYVVNLQLSSVTG